MNRTSLTITISLLISAILCGRVCQAASPRLDAAKIKAALRTASQEDDGFIDMVVSKVDQGTLPYKLVDSTFQWARKKPRHRFQYFKYGLIVRAKRIGISL